MANQLLRSKYELLLTITLFEVKARYRQSVLGLAWLLLFPIGMMLIYTLVFSLIVKIPSDGMPYPIFVFSGLLHWQLFANSVTKGCSSIVSKAPLIGKIAVDRMVFPVSSLLASFFDYAMGFLFFIVLLAIYSGSLHLGMPLVVFPLLLLIQVVFAMALVLVLSAAAVYVRDILYVVPVLVQGLFFLCPVVYPVSMVPESYRWIYFMNPMATTIHSYRLIFLHGQWPEAINLLPALGVSLLLLLVGLAFFKRLEVNFADII